MRAFFLSLILAALFAPIVHAQNAGGVFGPNVSEGSRAIQYRIAHSPDFDATVQRGHYQFAIDDNWQLRGVVQGISRANADFKYDLFQGELTRQLTENGADWARGLRFDVTLRDGGRPDQFGVNFMNQFKLSETWTAKALLLTNVQFGDRSADAIGISTRASLAYDVKGDGIGPIALELYSGYGRSDNLQNFEEQSHQFGPAVTVPLGNWSANASALFGLTDGTDDQQYRLFLGRNFK